MWLVFFFNDTATTEIYTLSLHDALPICSSTHATTRSAGHCSTSDGTKEHLLQSVGAQAAAERLDRKSTRLNSSHANISYAVFCLKKKKNDPAVADRDIVKRSLDI